MFKCDVYAQLLIDQTQKRFLSLLYVFESDFCIEMYGAQKAKG